MDAVAPDRQIEFLTNLQRLLSEGAFVATYKYALLLSLADVCVEMGHDNDAHLEVPTRLIAAKFIQYYWRQSAPYHAAAAQVSNAPVLRQNTGGQAGIIRVIVQARDRFEGSLTDAQGSRAEWNHLVSAVDRYVREMPLWKLQTVGPERLDFLYANSGIGRTITLKPGVAFCFRKHHALVTDMVRGAWARYVRRFNPDVLGAGSDLHEFLFGSERADLSVVVPILNDFQKGSCFYCRGRLKGEAGQVDHFIPWSRYPVDLGHNFVLTHGACNGRKSDRLASEEHLAEWANFHERHSEVLAREFDRKGVIADFAASVRIVTWAYAQTFEAGGLTWLRGDDLRPLAPEWSQAIERLLN